MQLPLRKTLSCTTLAIVAALAGSSATAGDWDGLSQEAQDAYREGQLFASYVTNPALESYEIKSDVEGSTVSLSGTVETSFEKALAEAIASGLEDVTEIDNNIQVDPEMVLLTTVVPINSYAQHVRDASTSMKVNSRLLWNDYTDGLDIDVVTRDGKVTLVGTADTEKAKLRAGEIARTTLGVTALENRLAVKGVAAEDATERVERSDSWIQDKVATSYRYASGIDIADIELAVDGGKVTISGMADGPLERQRVIEIAQHTLGVNAVLADSLEVDNSLEMAQIKS